MNLSKEQKDELVKDVIKSTQQCFNEKVYIRLRLFLDTPDGWGDGDEKALSLPDVENMKQLFSKIRPVASYGTTPMTSVGYTGGYCFTFTKENEIETDLDLEFIDGMVDINSEEYDEEIMLSIDETIQWLIVNAGFQTQPKTV